MEVLGDSQVVAGRKRQIAELRLPLETVQTDDHDATVAKAQLETQTDSQRLHEAYCRNEDGI